MKQKKKNKKITKLKINEIKPNAAITLFSLSHFNTFFSSSFHSHFNLCEIFLFFLHFFTFILFFNLLLIVYLVFVFFVHNLCFKSTEKKKTYFSNINKIK